MTTLRLLVVSSVLLMLYACDTTSPDPSEGGPSSFACQSLTYDPTPAQLDKQADNPTPQPTC